MCLKRAYLNIIKAIYKKLIANLIFNGEKLKVFLYTLQSKLAKCRNRHLNPAGFD